MASDERLVEHVRAGSEAAFEQVYDRHHRGILGFCRHMLGSAEEAEDAVQHTFMAAYRDLVGSDKPIQLRAWLYTIARNRCYSTLRARRERPLREDDDPPTENLSSEVQRRQDLRDLLSDLSGLPDDQRAALVLAELGAGSHEEIATVLDVPREKVKALVFQARTSLIASRKARDTPCEEIREQIASLRGGSLRRTTLRRHLHECPGCRAFRKEVELQRRALAVALPVLPTLGLKHTALAAAFGSGSAGGGAAVAAGGAGAAASSAVAGGGGTLAAKALVAVALVGGGTAGVSATRDSGSRHHRATPSAHKRAVRAGAPLPSAPGGTPRAVAVAVPVAAAHRDAAPATERRAEARKRRIRHAAARRHKHKHAAPHPTSAPAPPRHSAAVPRHHDGHDHSGRGKDGGHEDHGGGDDTRGSQHARPVPTAAPPVVKHHDGDGEAKGDGEHSHGGESDASLPPVHAAPVPALPSPDPRKGSGDSGHGGNSGDGDSGGDQH
jgi:RNA polymerase sigma factor (sigma-70 family)